VFYLFLPSKNYWLFNVHLLEFDIGRLGKNLDSTRAPRIEKVWATLLYWKQPRSLISSNFTSAKVELGKQMNTGLPFL
jgi:hypothetical protein